MQQYKIKIITRLKPSVKDSQGSALYNVLNKNENNIRNSIKVGKYFEIEIEANSIENAETKAKDISIKYLSNPVLEEYEILEINEQ